MLSPPFYIASHIKQADACLNFSSSILPALARLSGAETMDNRQRLDPHIPVFVFEGVVPSHLLETINASIDAARHEWRPPDGRRECTQASRFVELLRTAESFAKMEIQVCTAARRWAASVLGRKLDGEPCCVLRRVDQSIPGQSYLRHFDSHILTILVPLQMAGTGECNGDLMVCLEQRKRVSAFTHVVVKTWLCIEHRFPFSIRRILIALHGYRRRYERITCMPGNVYVFNGLITLHHNLHVASGERRSLIIHYYDPGLASGARSAISKLRTLGDQAGDWFSRGRQGGSQSP